MNIFYVAKSFFCKTCSSWIFLQQLLNNFLTCKPSVHITHYVLVRSLEFQSISELGMHHIFCLCQLQCSPTSSSQSHAMALAPLQLFRSYSAFDAKKTKTKAGKGMERDKNRRKICHLPSDPTINLDTVCSLFSYGPNLLHFFFAPFVTPRPCFHIRATGANGAMARKGENK